MRRINAILLFVGCITGLMAAQQPPSPPPPPPAASQPPSAQPADAQAAQQQIQQQQQQMQEQIQQQQQQIEKLQQQLQQQQGQQGQVQQQQGQQQQPQVQQPEQQIHQMQQIEQQQQNATQPALPSQTQQEVKQQAAEDAKNLPESDKLDAQRAEAQRAEAQKQLDEIQNKEELAELRVKDQGRLRESRAVLKELLTGTTGKFRIPSSLLQQSRCVVVIPAVKKAAVGFGANYGRGVMSCRLGDDFNGQWSAPAMYALEGGNFGFQIGLKGTDLVLLIMNGRGADSILRSKVKLGGDVSVAAGPIGRSAEASTDLAMRAKILSYSRAHGIFAGVALDGSTLRPDNRANQALYGREISAREIVRSGAVTPPTGSMPLLRLLEQSTRASSETKPSAQAQSPQPK